VHDHDINLHAAEFAGGQTQEPVPPVEWCDEAMVEKKFGVPASQLVDLLGLMGDSIDNIPGAPALAPKAPCKHQTVRLDRKRVAALGRNQNTRPIANRCATTRR